MGNDIFLSGDLEAAGEELATAEPLELADNPGRRFLRAIPSTGGEDDAWDADTDRPRFVTSLGEPSLLIVITELGGFGDGLEEPGASEGMDAVLCRVQVNDI